MMPADGIEVARGFDAILLGAVGDPAVPDDVSLWGLLFALRQQLDLWANVRPVKLLPGVPCPLTGRGAEDVDMLFVRENSEGEYSGVGGRVHAGYPGELAIESTVFTRAGVERVVRFAFEQARAARTPDERDEVERVPAHLGALGRGRRGDLRGVSGRGDRARARRRARRADGSQS